MIIRDFNKAAIITHDGEVSYRQLMGNILSYADMMPKAEQFSLAEGEKMKTLILSENRSEWIYAFFAVWHNEAIAVPVDATSTVHDVAYIMNDCRPQCIFTSREKEQLARDAMREAGVEMTVIVFEDNVPEPRDVAEGQEFRFENTSAVPHYIYLGHYRFAKGCDAVIREPGGKHTRCG